MTTITFWSNGFQVNDGPFRDNEAEENKAFLADIAKGCVRARGGDRAAAPLAVLTVSVAGMPRRQLRPA